MDRYLPALQTVSYLSRTSPQVIGHTYALSRELSSLQELAADPLEIIANPEAAADALDNITLQAIALESDFEMVRLAIKAAETDGASELADVRDVLDTLGPGVTLLRHVTAGTSSLVTMAEAIESEGFLSKEFGAKAGLALDEAQQELTLARAQVTSLQRLLSLQGIDAETFLPSSVLGGESEGSTSSTERVELMLDEAISATNFLYSFLGFEEPRIYLLLGQNQNEVRATGGFIGLAARATVDRGELTELVFQDSTTVDSPPYADNPLPPEGLYWYLWMGRLLFRDANWNPHFPASAAKVAEIYRTAQGVQVDGVVTATKLMALDLVELFGDVTVPELDEVLTRKSADDYTEGRLPYDCLPRHASARGKRCFGEDMFFALQDRLTAGVPSSLRRSLVGLFKEHLDLKNVLIHVFPPTDDSFLWERGWNGAVPLVDHDYLMVVDSSLPGHTAAVVHRSWEYNVSLNPGQPIEAELRLRYDNREQTNDKICHQVVPSLGPCYWNYFRVYVSPKASSIEMPSVPLHEGSLKLIWGYPDADSASVVPNADSGPAQLTELGGYITVQPGSITTVPIQYRLPEILRPVAPDVFEYRLLLQKQPGMDRDRVSIVVELPPNAELLSTSPEYNSIRGQRLLFDFTLSRDTTVAVSFRMKREG